MALTRKFLNALDIDSEKIDEIIEAHTDTVDGLKKQIEQYKTDADSLPAIKEQLAAVTEERDTLKAAAEKNGESIYKKQYDDLKSEYDKYKSDQEAKELLSKKTHAYKEILKEIGISEKRIDSVLKVTDFKTVDLDSEGKIKNSDELKTNLKTEWSDFIAKDGQQGAQTNTPPANNGGEPKGQSRAAKIAAQYHANLYGTNNSQQEGK